MTLYLTSKEMNRSLSEAGLVIALFGMGAIIGSYFGGKFTDKIGFQKVQLITLLCGGILFIVLGQIKSYPLICLCTFILSTVNEAFRPANSSAIAFYSTPKNRTRSYSLNRMAINLGWAVGASIGGFIAAYNYELLFWVDGFTNIGAAFILFFVLKPAHKKSTEEKPKEVEVPIAHSAYKDKTYLWFIFLVTLFAFCFFQLFTTIPKYFRDNLHLGERYIGFVMALNGLLIVALEMVIIVMLEKKNRNLQIISVGLLVCAASFLALLIPGYGKIISLLMILLITLGEIMAMPFMNTFWTLRSNEKNRGQYAALYSIAWGIAQTAGPYLCSKLVEATNFNVMFITIAGVFIFTAFCFYRLSKGEKPLS